MTVTTDILKLLKKQYVWGVKVERIETADCHLLAEGNNNLVYQHPDKPTQLIKVSKHQDNGPASVGPFYQGKMRRLPNTWEIANQMIEFLAVRELEGETSKHIENVYGIVETTQGLGLVVEGVWDGPNLAPTLLQLIHSGTFDSTHEESLKSLTDWVRNTYVIIRDLGVNNVVWDKSAERWVIIDGIGSLPTLSLRSLSQRYNKRSNLKRADKLESRAAKHIAAYSKNLESAAG